MDTLITVLAQIRGLGLAGGLLKQLLKEEQEPQGAPLALYTWVENGDPDITKPLEEDMQAEAKVCAGDMVDDDPGTGQSEFKLMQPRRVEYDSVFSGGDNSNDSCSDPIQLEKVKNVTNVEQTKIDPEGEHTPEGTHEVDSVVDVREVGGEVVYLVQLMGFPNEVDESCEPQQIKLDYVTIKKEERNMSRDIGIKKDVEDMIKKLNSGLMPCLICSTQSLPIFMTRDSRLTDRHNLKYHSVSTLDVYPCQLCDEWFSSRTNLKEHVGFHDVSRNSERLYCNICKFSSKAKMLSKGHKKGPYFTMAFGNSLIKEHVTSHNTIYDCEVCEKSFTGRRRYKDHVHRHETGFHHCETCDYKSKNNVDLTIHRKKYHTMQFDFPCLQCDQKFVIHRLLIKHMKYMHSGAEPLGCSECSKTFRNNVLLGYHFKAVHQNLPNHICSQCGKKVKDLKIHETIHTGDKTFICEVCHATFRRSVQKSRHMKIHTGVKPHVCPVCGKGFIQRSNMKIHKSMCM